MHLPGIMYIFSLDGEEVDLILVRSTERAQVPVKDNSAAIEADTDFTRRNALVSDVKRDTLLEVAARLRNGDRAKDGDFDLSYDLDAKVGEVVVDHDLIDGLALEFCNLQIIGRQMLTSRGPIETR